MALSSELIDQLIKVTQNTEPRDKDNTAYGTVVIMGSKKYVKIDGSDLMTPVSSTVAVENGDRVIVTIKSHSATVTGNTSSPAASDKKVTELGTKISDFEIVIADKVSAKELDVQIGRIDDLTADNATIKETLTANKASIDDLTAKNVEITGTLEANKAKIDDLDAKKLDAEVADIKYASVERLDATDANLRNLKSDYAQFEKTTTDELEATNAKIDGLDTKYANVDFSNIGKAAIQQFFATSGIIKDLVVGDQTITGELVGITITGDLIKGNTIVADKLVIKGSDGLYYKLNTDGVTTEKEQTEYNSLNGQIIQAKSITATKIDVKDLVAFGATIGGFNIGQDSIFSGVKETVDNKSRGIYMDENGQIAIGDVNNYIKYFKDTDGRYRLKISADSLEFNASGDSGEESKDLETVIKDINNRVDNIAETNKGIGSITNYYLATFESSGVTTKTAGWTTKIQNVSSSKKYLWNYEVTKYTDDTIANTTEPCIIGMYSAVGATGNGIQKITEYYALSALKDSVPTVWSENVPNLTATNKYLWNYEEILYTNGGTELTKKRIIGVYGDTGKDGATGPKGDGLDVKDTRDTNESPNWYIINYPLHTVMEFKKCSVIGLSNVGEFCVLQTVVPWKDTAGGYPKQTAKVEGTGKEYWRVGTSTTAWSSWVDPYGKSLDAAKTATNFMEFTSGTGLQIGDKTNGTWKGFRSRITSEAFEILNEVGTSVASYGRKLIQLGKDSTDAVIELCGRKGKISFTNRQSSTSWSSDKDLDDLTLTSESIRLDGHDVALNTTNEGILDSIAEDKTAHAYTRLWSSIDNQSVRPDAGFNVTVDSYYGQVNSRFAMESEAYTKTTSIVMQAAYTDSRGQSTKVEVKPDALYINNKSFLDRTYPVGSIYLSVNNTNPTNFFGGTWVAWGAGRVPVGFNSGDGNFNSSEKTGGSKTINISHSHTVNGHNHVASVGYDDNAYYAGAPYGSIVLSSTGWGWKAASNWSQSPIRLSYTSSSSPGTNSQLSTTQSILQPYITCYMWKRTA